VTAELELAEPAWLLALLLPIALLLGARAFVRPERLATGTLEIWRRVAGERAPASPRRRRRIPPAVLLLALGLALGAVALARPRFSTSSARRSFRLLVDGSPSMDLALGSGTRRDRAEAMARAWISREFPDAGLVRVVRPGRLGLEDDVDGAIWITDRAPSPPPAHAGWFASGGPAVPGPVAVDGTTRFDWDGKDLVAVADGTPRRTIVVRGALPKPVAGVLEAWASARGAMVGTTDPAALAVVGAGTGAPVRAEASRDGWSAAIEITASAPDSDADGPLEAWIADPSGRKLLSFGAGRVHCPWSSMEDPRGDPAAFAVSWASLFDRAVLPPPGIVALADRASSGTEASSPPSAGSTPAGPLPRNLLPAYLAAAACLCAAGAWCLSGRC
jgi:hypothetical protein